MALTASVVMAGELGNAASVSLAPGSLAVGPTVMAGVVVRNTDAANAGVFRIYDNPSAASGTVLFTAKLAADAHSHFIFPGQGVVAFTGLYATMTGASSTVEGTVLIA